MSGVQRHQREPPGHNAFDDSAACFNTHLAIANVPPPNQDVTIVQGVLAESLFWVVKPGRLDHQPGLPGEVSGNFVAKKVGVSLLLSRLLLIPNDDANRSRNSSDDRPQDSQEGKKPSHKYLQRRFGRNFNMIGMGTGSDA